jgi:hypothetical protein
MDLIKILASGIYTMWSLSLAAALMGHLVSLLKPNSQHLDAVWRSFARIHQELWIAVPPCVALAAVDHWHGHSYFGLFVDAMTLYNWARFKDWPDENRWKRRGRKLKDAVAERAGRLVVVPT